ncbi:copper chaperone PCu(A)C [Streptomyces sp. NBC_01142]|uniref:copper chaperone PCu(A)C n=1 Tax=Streptomyces sp. NBC_01142 TaxID=2975865 RepID=UPI002250ADE1|nr:copper chaperone PCu(A)C [Streptomyces sp. NBC_01142]MCX4824287.1 copper chaperone PCu(A)C [Streptomyces sp. NBC_01142]
MNRRTTLARTTLVAFIALSAGPALAGCSSSAGGEPALKVSGAFMPQPVDDMAAGFLRVENSGGTADRLTSVTSDISDDVTIHETKNQKMQRVKSFDVPADGELDLERGGNHIMFMKLKQKPEQGQKVAVELHFEKSDPITVELPVKESTYNPKKH